MAGELIPRKPGEFLIYQTDDGRTRIEVRVEKETVWLTQKQMTELFQTTKQNVSLHIQNIFEEGELLSSATVKEYLTVQTEGNRQVERNVEHYNLDVIISVGYRVKSLRGTQFRIWATQRLREYIVKGFTMDDERLKAAGGGNYFDELLDRIRDIRSSERVFWQKVLAIYATSIDYDAKADATKLFFQTVQNKMHWAIVGQTAAEIVHARVSAAKPQMGLTGWAGAKPRKGDVSIAKNYLNEDEIKALNLIVSAYLDFAELQAVTRKPMYMADWIRKLDDFIRISDREILTHAGKISHEAAKLKAETEYETFRAVQAALPQPVDRDFADTLDELKKIEGEAKAKKKPTPKKKGAAHDNLGASTPCAWAECPHQDNVSIFRPFLPTSRRYVHRVDMFRTICTFFDGKWTRRLRADGGANMTSKWRKTSLGAVTDLLTGYPFQSRNYTDEPDGIRLLRGDNIVQQCLRWDGLKRWPSGNIDGLHAYQLAEGDVVLAMDRPWIEAGLKYATLSTHDLPALLVQRVARLRGGLQLDTGFLRYLIGSRAFTDHVLAVQTGTAVPHISASQIKAFSFECPPLTEQKRIADILGTLDDKIELNRRTNETLEAIARALFKSWFVDFDPVRDKAAGRKPVGMDAETARLFSAEFEDSALGKVPKGWRVVPLPDAIGVNPTRSLSKGQFAPYLEMSNMPTSSVRALAWENREFGSGMRFVNGDTLVARITPCLENGKTAYVDFLADGQVGWGSTEYIVLQSKSPLPTTFSYFLARTDDFRSHVIKNMTGTSGRQRAPAECLNSYHIVVPSGAVAHRFGAFADGCLKAMKRNDEESTTLIAARDALLPRLLSGELHC